MLRPVPWSPGPDTILLCRPEFSHAGTKAVNRRAFPRRTQSKLANLYRGKHVIYVLLRNYCVVAKETDIALNYFLSSFVVMCQFSVSILGNSCGGAKHFLRLCLPSYLADKLTPFELLPVKIMG